MKYRLLKWLCCPRCRGVDLRLETTRSLRRPVLAGQFDEEPEELPGVDLERREETHVVEGSLHCGDCAAVYPIEEGIPRMMVKGASEGPRSAHRWTTFDSAVPEWEENFQDLSQPLDPMDFLGKLCLDAGCGFGRHAFYAARYGAEVVAMDSSLDALLAAKANAGHLARVHLVQADLYNPPFRERVFDLVYSFGVLHHLERPSEALQSISELVKAGGRLSLWVYGPRQGTTKHVSNALRGVTSNLEPDELHRLSKGIATGLRVFSHTPYRVLGKVPVMGRVVSHLPVHDHHKWPYEVVVADVYDRLRIPVRHWFTGEQLEGWLYEEGYADVRVTRRVANNETFRATGIKR